MRVSDVLQLQTNSPVFGTAYLESTSAKAAQTQLLHECEVIISMFTSKDLKYAHDHIQVTGPQCLCIAPFNLA